MRGDNSRRGALINPPLAAPLAAGELPPKKVAWLSPWQLLQTAFHVWIETVGKGFVDRREVMAALDRSANPNATFAGGLVKPGQCIDGFVDDAALGDDRALSVDFVADVGDSWEATYAIASLMAQNNLREMIGESAAKAVSGCLPRADVLVLGGDLVYPWPARDTYRRRLIAPLSAAFPRNPSSCPQPSLVAIPGNHDWYDGLNGFTRALCQGDSLGGWKLGQRRSYFALKLIAGWWIWGIDIALDTRVDAPQFAYFNSILDSKTITDPKQWPVDEKFKDGDRIILCTAKPAWLEMSRYSDDAYRNLMTFVDHMIAKHNDVPLILTGDLHHYCHYQAVPSGKDSDECKSNSPSHLIVSGGGGAYLMGTHFLPQNIPPLTSPPAFPELLPNGPEPTSQTNAFRLTAVQYPNMLESRRLALGSLRLAFRPANWLFCLILGLIYLLMTPGTRSETQRIWLHSAHLLQLARGSVSLVWAAIVFALCIVFAMAANDRASHVKTFLWGSLHGIVHVVLAFVLFVEMTAVSNLMVRPPMLVVVGGFIAGTAVGIYLALSDRYLDLHHNEAFAVQSIVDYRNFLRMVIEPNGTLVIYPIGLRLVPRRWRKRVDATDTDSQYEPADAILSPHLIEGPIRISPKPKPKTTT